MKRKSSKPLKSLPALLAAALWLLAPMSAQRAQEPAPQESPAARQSPAAQAKSDAQAAQADEASLVTAYAPGSRAAFPETFDAAAASGKPLVYARPAGAEPSAAGPAWVLSASFLDAPPELAAPPAPAATPNAGAAATPTAGAAATPAASAAASSSTPTPASSPAPTPSPSPEPTPATTPAPTPAPAAAPAPPRKLLVFTVPQLPRGVYEVSYADSGRGLTTRILVEPHLRAARGLLTGKPGDELEVSFGIEAVHVVAEDAGVSPRRVEVTLAPGDASVVELAPGEAAAKTTGDDGFATWKVRLKAEGEAMLAAAAPDFVPAATRVVSAAPPPAAAPPRARSADRKAAEAAEAAAREERKARDAQADADKAAAELLMLEEQLSGGRKSGPGDEAAARAEAQRARERVGGAREALARSQSTLKGAARAEARRLGEFFDARAEALRWEPASGLDRQRVGPGPGPLSPDDLLPGDVILMGGVKPLSAAIMGGETGVYGKFAIYSHAALYVGGGQVAEMLGGGYTLQPVAASIKGATHAHVYRWPRLARAQGELVARHARTFAGRLYAEQQIKVLATLAARDATRAVLALGGPQAIAAGFALVELEVALRGLVVDADRLSGGARQLICSELVAQSYHHAGLPAPFDARWNVTFWPSLSPLLTSDDRRHDYTTPNSLAFSGLLQKVGWLGG